MGVNSSIKTMVKIGILNDKSSLPYEPTKYKKGPSPRLWRTARLKKVKKSHHDLENQVCTFNGDLARRDQAITIHKGKGKFKQYKDILFKGWLSKGQKYFSGQSIFAEKTVKTKHVQCKKITGVLLYIRQRWARATFFWVRNRNSATWRKHFRNRNSATF